MLCGSEIKEQGRICNNCFSKISWISKPCCSKCGYPFPAKLDLKEKTLCPSCLAGNLKYLDWVRAVCVYNDESKKIILPLKHNDKIGLADVFNPYIIRLLDDYDGKIDLIVPMPLSNRRLFERGYNQAVLIAKPISKKLNVKIDFDSVKRIHKDSMGHLSFKARHDNIKGVFHIDQKDFSKFKGKTVLLIDDVMTTGASLLELAKMLKKAGAKAVIAVVMARVIKDI